MNLDPTGHIAAQFPELERILSPRPPRRELRMVRRPRLRWKGLADPSPDPAKAHRIAQFLRALLLSQAIRERGRWTARLALAAIYLSQVRERQLRALDIASRGPWAALAL